MQVWPAQFGFRNKPVPLDANMLLCISYHYSVILTDKHNITDLIHWFCIQHYYMFRLSTSANIRLSSIHKKNKKWERPFITKRGNKIFENFDNLYSVKKSNKIENCIENFPSS